MQTLPGFLIAGAMKAGTTTLYYDLLAHPDVFFPVDKEVNALLDSAATTPAGMQRYAEFYRQAKPHQLCGDASTAYTMRPAHEGVAARAAAVLPDRFKIIYIVREPVSRIVSHYHHATTAGCHTETDFAAGDINQAVREHTPLIDYTRYAWQIQPWIEQFGAERVRIVLFEEYIAHRRSTVNSLCGFLGLQQLPETVEPLRAYTVSRAKPLERGWFFALSQHPLYRRCIRPLTSQHLRETVRRAVFPRSQAPPQTPKPCTLQFIRDELASDHEALRRLMHRPQPLWQATAPETTPAESLAQRAGPPRRLEEEGRV